MNKFFAELFGTFILVFFGTGTAVMTVLNPENNVGHLGIAIAFGLTIVAACYSIGHISGGHLNPAISLAMYMDKRINLKTLIGYMIFQIIGAIIATTIIWVILHTTNINVSNYTYGQNTLGSLNVLGALLTEFILSTVFIFVVLSVTKESFTSSNIAVLIIGLTLTLVHLIGIPLTGTSVNPARSIGPAIFAQDNALKELWIFILAPLLGAICATFLHKSFENKGYKNK
ncbi:MIP family channel protein [Mammaliicoccus sciuri]|nr:MIP family channel protein [Mammaliicoccus sciuri]